jgi:uncharacterized ferritin-like protein (DUF455 family)
VLLTAEARGKAHRTAFWARRLRDTYPHYSADLPAMPDRPARPGAPLLLTPGKMPKRGKAGSPASRIALLHALAHIELNAIDLAWDMIGRFGTQFPPAFSIDWLRVARDEARHFLLLLRRLRQLGSDYGALPAHDGLWEAAQKSAHDPIARLALVPMVLEARGLDVTPQTCERLLAAGDAPSAAVLKVIYEDEISHVRIGTCWFQHACAGQNLPPESTFHAMIRSHLRGSLKPPFNHKARISAGLLPDFYTPLASGGRSC